MPIEIKELHVKINVDNDRDSAPMRPVSPQRKKEQIVAECVEQVMQLLSNNKER